MGVLGAPLYHVGVINGSYWYLRRLSMEKLVDLKVLSVLTTYDVVWGVSIQSHPNTIL
jgi:hypothetical protein